VRNHTRRHRVARLWAALAALVAVPAMLTVSTTSAAVAASSNALTIKAGEYVYELKGSPKGGWTQITFENAGTEYHMVAMFKLKKGTTNAQLKQAVTSEDQSAIGKIAAPGDPGINGTPAVLSPKQKTTTYTQLPAGTYGIACFIPASDGETHAQHGMFKVFTVSGKSSAKPPTDGVTAVTISDAGIAVPSSGVPAHAWLKVTNNTSVSRDLTAAEYTSPDATFETANAYYNSLFSGSAPAGDPPATLNGGLGLNANSSGYVQLDLAKGRYALVSSNQDTDTSDPNPLHYDFTVG
jgi:hypothetical protein